MDVIYLKVKVKRSDRIAEQLRNQGHFFDAIADVLDIGIDQIEEIDDSNLDKNLKAIEKQWR